MPAFLLTWNPDNFNWTTLPQEVADLASGRPVAGSWSCGNTKRIPLGARVFLLRQDSRGRGILGGGWVTRAPFPAAHWDDAKAQRGVMANYVDVEFDALLAPGRDELLDVHRIETPPLSRVHWGTQSSGIEIEPAAARRLEELWTEHLGGTPSPVAVIDEVVGALEGVERVRMIRHRSRERSLRAAKIQATLDAAPDERLRCEVPGCGFDFEERYGELGRGFAHVHHLLPLATLDSPVVTTLEDLVIVCANCHAMIHRGGECRPLGELIS